MKGLTIQPLMLGILTTLLLIAGLLCVVDMMMLTVLLPDSPRTFSTIVRPSMFGMLTSQMTSLVPG